MTSKVESRMISRRGMLPFLGLATALGLVLRSTAAEAQTSGMERRQDRRGERVNRRYERCRGKPASKEPTQGQPAPTPTQPV